MVVVTRTESVSLERFKLVHIASHPLSVPIQVQTHLEASDRFSSVILEDPLFLRVEHSDSVPTEDPREI